VRSWLSQLWQLWSVFAAEITWYAEYSEKNARNSAMVDRGESIFTLQISEQVRAIVSEQRSTREQVGNCCGVSVMGLKGGNCKGGR